MVGKNGETLAALRRRVEAWRRSPHRGRRMPEPLWAAAVEAARDHGLWKTARGVRLDYYSLKRRISATPRRRRQQAPALQPSALRFIEVPSVSPVRAACTLELQDRHGRRLRVELPDAAGAEALARALWRDRR